MRENSTPDVCFDDFQQWITQNPLRLYRERQHVTQRVLAHVFGVSAGTVKNWESGIGRPKPEHLSKLFGADELSKRWDEWINQKPESNRRIA